MVPDCETALWNPCPEQELLHPRNGGHVITRGCWFHKHTLHLSCVVTPSSGRDATACLPASMEPSPYSHEGWHVAQTLPYQGQISILSRLHSQQTFKIFAFELSISMTDIMNFSLASIYVPSQWKKAIVVPVPKGDPHTIHGQTPPNLSLTCTL